MTDTLESELDQLFQLAPSALVEARGALADRLKKAGQREAAARIKGIKRPSPAAWSINQVFFQTARGGAGACPGRAGQRAGCRQECRGGRDPRSW